MKKAEIDLKTSKYIRILLFIATALIITAMFPESETIETDYSEGMIWSKEDLIAPFTFPVYKSDEAYQQEVNDARKNSIPIYVENRSRTNNWLDSLNTIFSNIKKALNYQSEIDKERSLPEEKRAADPQTLKNYRNNVNIILSDNDWQILFDLYNNRIPEHNFESFQKIIVFTLNELNSRVLVDTIVTGFTSDQISYIKNHVQEYIPVSEVVPRSDIQRIINESFKSNFKRSELITIATQISNPYVNYVYTYEPAETEKVLSSVTEKVPKTIGIVRENERIVSKHEVITDGILLKLRSYYRIRNEQMGSRDFYLQSFGRLIFSSTLLGLIGFFLFKMRNKVFMDNSRLAIISSIILLTCIFAYISLHVKINYPIEYMITVPVAAILLTIIFDSRLAFYVNIIICLLIVAIRGGDFGILIPHLVASSLSIYSVRDIKNRSQIFISMVYIFIGYFLTITALNFETNNSWSVYSNRILMAGINSALSPVLVYGLLLFYERVFRIATDLVFLELSDFNHPLLRELAAKAPGTFHHSMVMSTLSEQAAKEIDANQILARVGCYYHDIGKIVKPDYFVENQLDSNKHEELNPSLSAKVIISHVRFGIQLAEKYRLPDELIRFIPMHHGTTLVSYFYEKARGDDMKSDEIHDFIYRYPGPKPKTKETGIVMLADSVEAASRAIDEPTPAKIETQIDEIIKARFMEGELDECPLTLNDLLKIKKSFLRTLVGIHHHRIRYPESDDDDEVL